MQADFDHCFHAIGQVSWMISGNSLTMQSSRTSSSGCAAVNSLSLGTKYSLAKNGCTDIRTDLGLEPLL